MDNPLEKLVLTDEETLTEVVNCLAKNIPINSTGAGDPQNLFKVLVRAASKQDTKIISFKTNAFFLESSC